MRPSIHFLIYCLLLSCNNNPSLSPTPAERISLPYYTSADFTPQWFESSAVPGTLHFIPSFSFSDQDGDTISEKTVAGKIYIADFFFTACNGICPQLTKNLKVVHEAFINDSEVLILSHSVTPDKDRPPVLKKYAIAHKIAGQKWLLLTGNRDSIYRIARTGYFAEEDLGLKKDSNDFLHTENILLIDRKRRIRGLYKGTSPAEIQNLISDIKLLKAEKVD